MKGLDIDDPQTTLLRKRIIKEKTFLKQIYQEWYSSISHTLHRADGPVLELGSGAGFLEEYIPDLITSEIFFCPTVKIVLDGCFLPFADQSLGSVVMVDVLHHISRSRCFFAEAARCVRVGGQIIMTEPWVTSWSKFIYSKIHHEPFLPEAKEWEFSRKGPLSGANSALPWIIFQRDRKKFETEFPEWRIKEIKLHTPFCYLLSGGVSFRSFVPGCLFGMFRRIENIIRPWMHSWAMFAQVVLVRKNV